MIINITQYLDNISELFPDKIAFEDKCNTITFSQLKERAKSLGSLLWSNSEKKRNLPIAVYLPKSVNSIICFLASAYSGNFYSPLDTSMPLPRIKKIIDILNPFFILTDKNGIEIFKNIENNSILIDITEIKNNYVLTEDIKTIDTDPLYVMFTSGSTGTPKGVVISHRSVIDYTEWLFDTFDFNENTVFGNQAPFYFDNSILDIFSTLRNGCRTVIIPEEIFLSPVNLLKYLDEKNINTIFWVPSVLVMIANTKVLEKYKPNYINKILFCGEVMPCKHLNIWRNNLPDVMYANLYGPTEITDVCTYYIVNRKFDDDASLPIGMTCKNTEVVVLDENNEQVTGNNIGELCIKGTCLSLGYYRDKEKTNENFIQNPLINTYSEKIYRTGDLVFYNEHNELMFAGRKDYQIKHLGHRIELGEIETIASSFENVEQCCSVYNEEEKKLILIISPVNIDENNLYKYIKERLPHYMLPSKIYKFDVFPLNQNGKIDRIKLKSKISTLC